jgi:hypothetical protein
VALGPGISILPDRTMQTEVEQKRLVLIPLHGPELVNASHLPEVSAPRGPAPRPKKQPRVAAKNSHAIIH